MKNKIHLITIAFILFSIPNISSAQSPNLGTAANFVLFSTNGAVTNTGISHVTGNVGTNNGSSTGFGNVDGVMHDGGSASAQCASDLLRAYNQLNGTVATFFPASLLGNGQTLTAGVYSIPSAATMNGTLTLDGQSNSNAVFIFKIHGSFSTAAASKVKLINGALACNVFWKVDGLISMAAGTSMKGTMIANNAAINMNIGDTLEGRALSTTGAVTTNGVLVYTPIGCGSPVLTGPAAPALASTECYAIFSSNGAVSNSGITHVIGDVGTNVGLTTGFDTLLVTGTVHPIPDVSTAQCAADLHNVYLYLNGLPYDIQLLYPAQFGNNLVLTPHTYLLNAATTFTDTVFLNAEGDSNAVFVIKINGALSTSTYSTVQLINGTKAKNVYWLVQGAVSINNYSVFCGTLVVNNGALGALNTGVVLNGRALTTNGALTTSAITAIMPPGCSSGPPVTATQPINQTACIGSSVSFSVIVHGTGLTYQWRNGTTNLNNGGNISGANSAILTFDTVRIADTSSYYNVIVTGTFSPNDTSTNASLQVNSAMNITTAPTSQIACAGSAVNFSVAASGATNYQWRKGTTYLVNGGNISGATSDTLTIDSANVSDTAADYNVIITGMCSNDTSVNVALSLCPNGIATINAEKVITIFPNPFTTSINIKINDGSSFAICELKMYNILGEEVTNTPVTKQSVNIKTDGLPSGIYFYNVIGNDKIVQSGKLISKQ
jgi:hypothetical protein